jgi:hypothetical protein
MVCIEIISAGIYEVNRIASAVGEHVIAQNALTSGGECICVDESAYAGVVVTALEVIEVGLLVVDVATAAKMAFFTVH